MRKKFLINIAFLVTLNLLVKPFWIFGIDRTIQDMVGNAQYGLYFAMFNFSFLFSTILDAGITNYNNQSVAQNHNFLHQNFAKLASLKLVLGAVYLTVTIWAGFYMNFGFNGMELLIFLTLNQFILSFTLFLRSNISGLQIFWLDSLLSVLDRLLLIAICAALIWGGITHQLFKIKWLAYAQTVAYSVTFVLALLIVVSKSGSFVSTPKIQFVKSTFKKSLPFAFIILFMSLYFRIDAVMIKELLPDGNAQAGLYAQGYRFLDIINNFIFLFTSILFPLFSKEIANGKSIQKLVSFSTELLTLPFAVITGLALFFSSQIMELTYLDTNQNASNTFNVLLIGYLPMVFSSVFGTVLTAAGKLKSMLVLSGLSFLLNIILNLVLIPKHGIIGAAFASFASQLFMGVGCTISTFQYFKIKLSLFYFLRSVSFAVLSLGVVFLVLPKLNLLQNLSVLLLLGSLHGLYFIFSSYKEFKMLTLKS